MLEVERRKYQPKEAGADGEPCLMVPGSPSWRRVPLQATVANVAAQIVEVGQQDRAQFVYVAIPGARKI
jgi:hypothetical protein